MVTNTQIKTGYTQTDIGVVPENWEVKKLGELANIYDGTHQTPHYVSDGFPFYSVENITNNDFTNTKYISYEEHKLLSKRCKIEKNDILMTRIGSIGDCKLITWNPDASFYVSLALIKPVNKEHAPFLYFYSKTRSFQKEVDDRSLQWAIPKKINLGEIENIRIPLPKDEKERDSITEVFFDIEDLLDKLDQLIEKKRNIKQGTMQELLTGKRRLHGFHSEWETNKIGSIIDLEKGKQLSRWYLTETGDYPVWNGGTEPSGYTTSWNTENDSITISEGGNSCGFVNYCEERFWRGGHCYLVNLITDSLIYTFLYHLLKYKESSIMNLRVGSGLPNIQKKELDNFELNYPKDKREQEEISKALSNMEKELELLENQKSKYLDIKQGMMQQLLTGRIRLV